MKKINNSERLSIFLIQRILTPVVTITADESAGDIYMHCAEIEKKRRMTNKELSRWLREKPMGEYKYKNDDYIHSFYEYKECYADEELDDLFLIREDDGEWREPLVEFSS